MIALVSDFLRNESGTAALEYALIAALLSILLVSGASATGHGIAVHYSALVNRLP